MPEDWWSIYPGDRLPGAVRLRRDVRAGGRDPPAPAADAGGRGEACGTCGWSRSPRRNGGTEAASAPLALHIEPYIETRTTLRPQRKKGRRKADYEVTVTNKANAPVLVALEGEDPDGELQYGVQPPAAGDPAGRSGDDPRCGCARRSRSGSAARSDRRLEVNTITGEEAAERAAAEPLGADVLSQQPPLAAQGPVPQRVQPTSPASTARASTSRRSTRRHEHRARAASSCACRKLPSPADAGPADEAAQRVPAQAAAAQAARPRPERAARRRCCPPRACSARSRGSRGGRSRWCSRCSRCCCCSTCCCRQNDHGAERRRPAVRVQGREEAHRGQPQAQPGPEDSRSTPSTSPARSSARRRRRARRPTRTRRSPSLVAVGTARSTCPRSVGITAGDAEKPLRAKQLTLGQASPQPIDPKALIETQIPAEGEVVKRGTPVNIFYQTRRRRRTTARRMRRRIRAAADRARAGGPAALVAVPQRSPCPPLRPERRRLRQGGGEPGARARRRCRSFDDAPVGHAVRAPTRPRAARRKKGDHVKLFVSAGQPKVVFSNGKDIMLADGATGQAAGPGRRRPAGGDRPDVERRRHPRRLHRRRARDAQGHHEEELEGASRSRPPPTSTTTSPGRRPPTRTCWP